MKIPKEISMKNSIVRVAAINVLRCEPIFTRDRNNVVTTTQDRNKDGDLLWSVWREQESFNEEFNKMEMTIEKCKSLVDISEGKHLVKVKEMSMGESKGGSYVAVNTFYTILSELDPNMKVSDLHTPMQKGAIPPSKRKAAAANATAVQ